MTKLHKAALIQSFEEDWLTFVEQYNSLEPDDQEVYLASQGYETLSTFLGHIALWLLETMRITPIKLAGKVVSYNFETIDEFNSYSVTVFAHFSDEDATVFFNKTVGAFARFLGKLTDEEIQNERVYKWIYNACFEHYEEHAFD